MYTFHVNIYIVFSILCVCVCVFGVSLSAFRFWINQQIDNRPSTTATNTTSVATSVSLSTLNSKHHKSSQGNNLNSIKTFLFLCKIHNKYVHIHNIYKIHTYIYTVYR